jgi:hypothetical protein
MNSTELDGAESGDNSGDDSGALGALFDQLLLPMAQQMRELHLGPFPLAPDVSWLSYYVRRRRSTMAPADFVAPACRDVAEFEQQLAVHWQALGRHALAAEVGQVGRAATAALAARRAREADPNGDPNAGAELSPYIYAMF